MWFLLFILNIFLSIALFSNQFSLDLRDKLGMFFYVRDIPGNEHVVYKEIMELKDELEDQWLEVQFSSKEDAFEFLQQRVPDVVTSFQKFGIENPLPATLYVMFDNEDEYQALRTSMIEHKQIILNIKDVDRWATLKQQENRVLTVINFTNFLKIASYVLMIVLIIIILIFLTFLLESIFQRFRKDLTIKKFLWATRWQVVKSFVYLTLSVVLGAIIISGLLVVLGGLVVSHYLVDLFDINLLTYLTENMRWLLSILIIEIVGLVGISSLVSSLFVASLNKKI